MAPKRQNKNQMAGRVREKAQRLLDRRTTTSDPDERHRLAVEAFRLVQEALTEEQRRTLRRRGTPDL